MGLPRTALAVLVAALGVAGCGRADDERAVGAVTERFLVAVAENDGARACAQLSRGARDTLVREKSKPCPQAVSELEALGPSRVVDAAVFATAAKVDLADAHSAFLELTREGWRLAAVGCRSEGGDAPYQCELEA